MPLINSVNFKMASGSGKQMQKTSFIFSNVQDPDEEIKLTLDERDVNVLFRRLTHAH